MLHLLHVEKIGYCVAEIPYCTSRSLDFLRYNLETSYLQLVILFLHTVRCTSFSGWNKTIVICSLYNNAHALSDDLGYVSRKSLRPMPDGGHRPRIHSQDWARNVSYYQTSGLKFDLKEAGEWSGACQRLTLLPGDGACMLGGREVAAS